jgi:hypothetical protein
MRIFSSVQGEVMNTLVHWHKHKLQTGGIKVLRTKSEKGQKGAGGAGEQNSPAGISSDSVKTVEPEIRHDDIELLEVCL